MSKNKPTDYEKACFQEFCLKMYGETFELKEMAVDERSGRRIPVFDLITPIPDEKETAIQLQCSFKGHGVKIYPKMQVFNQKGFINVIRSLQVPYIARPKFKQDSVVCARMFCRENEHYELKDAYGQYQIFYNGKFQSELVGSYHGVRCTAFVPSLNLVILNKELDLDHNPNPFKNYIFDIMTGVLLAETDTDVAFYDIEQKRL